MNDGYFKVLVIAVTAILMVSLTINFLLASDPQSLSGPPVRVTGYLTDRGEPASGYYAAPGQVPPTRSFLVPAPELR